MATAIDLSAFVFMGYWFMRVLDDVSQRGRYAVVMQGALTVAAFLLYLGYALT